MECSICFNKYDNVKRKPYILNPCGHCFCLECLNQLPNKNICPNDRGRIESKIFNRAVIEIIEGEADASSKPLTSIQASGSSKKNKAK